MYSVNEVVGHKHAIHVDMSLITENSDFFKKKLMSCTNYFSLLPASFCDGLVITLCGCLMLQKSEFMILEHQQLT